MKKILFLLLCGLANWATAQQKFYHLGDFKLENGQVIKDCKIGYRTFGKLNASKSNAVLVWFTGNSQQKSFVADPKASWIVPNILSLLSMPLAMVYRLHLLIALRKINFSRLSIFEIWRQVIN
jgi:hypothetical protein